MPRSGPTRRRSFSGADSWREWPAPARRCCVRWCSGASPSYQTRELVEPVEQLDRIAAVGGFLDAHGVQASPSPPRRSCPVDAYASISASMNSTWSMLNRPSVLRDRSAARFSATTADSGSFAPMKLTPRPCSGRICCLVGDGRLGLQDAQACAGSFRWPPGSCRACSEPWPGW